MPWTPAYIGLLCSPDSTSLCRQNLGKNSGPPLDQILDPLVNSNESVNSSESTNMLQICPNCPRLQMGAKLGFWIPTHCWIRNFPDGGANPQGGGTNLLFCQIFPTTCMKMNEIGSGGRTRVSGAHFRSAKVAPLLSAKTSIKFDYNI